MSNPERKRTPENEIQDLKEVFEKILKKVLKNEDKLKTLQTVDVVFKDMVNAELSTIAALQAKLEINEAEIDFLYNKVNELEQEIQKSRDRANCTESSSIRTEHGSGVR